MMATPHSITLRNAERMIGVHPRLISVVRAAAEATPLSVIEGVRTVARQTALYAQGRTKPGPIVTWTMNSKHLVQPDGFGHAVDLAPYRADGTIDWTDLAGFDRLAAEMLAAAEARGVGIRWGADWDRDGRPRERGETNSPHFELVANAGEGGR
jgi:peptidoglycan LD-endopeptidase CwlK